MNNKGYTLIELLVAIIIIGIILSMSFPAIRKLQEDNTYQKYQTYGDALIAAAKLYVDAYEEDLFLYDDDLAKLDANRLQDYLKTGQIIDGRGQCVFITYQDFKDHMLIKDINIDGMTCYSNNTFVRVIKKDGKFKFKYYLACGKKRGSGDSPIRDDKITFSLPDVNNYLPLENHTSERCRD